MKTLSPGRLDQDTPKWPEVRITLGPEPTVTVSGVITPVDDEAAAITRCAEQARALGRPIRVRVTTKADSLRRLIVSPLADVTEINDPGSPPATAPSDPKRPAARKGTGLLSRFPPALRPVIRWGAPIMALLVISSVVVMVLHSRSTADAVGPAPVAPTPPAGQLYTEHPPPGWSQKANWVIDLAKDAPAPVVAGDGTIVAVTAQDGSAVPTERDDRYLSVLEPTGQTRWATPLDTAPRTGPLVLTVDGAQVVVVAGTRDLTYRPLTGGPETVVPLPTGANITTTGMITLPGNRVAYLHASGLQTLEGLPRTDPAIAIDGAVIVTQPDNGAWWTLSADNAPAIVQPTPPAGAAGVERVLAVGTDQVWIGWNTAERQNCIGAVYERHNGTLIAAAPAPCPSLPRGGATYATNGTLAGVGSLIQTGNSLTAVKGLSVTGVVDQIYGTSAGADVVATNTGAVTPLPEGTLIPIGMSNDQLLVVGSTGRLYALMRS